MIGLSSYSRNDLTSEDIPFRRVAIAVLMAIAPVYLPSGVFSEARVLNLLVRLVATSCAPLVATAGNAICDLLREFSRSCPGILRECDGIVAVLVKLLAVGDERDLQQTCALVLSRLISEKYARNYCHVDL